MKESLNIFFSYGHDENRIIVDKIKSVLNSEKHNHHVWIDKDQIHHGNDWRREIVKGLNNSDEVIAFLSSYGLNKRKNPRTDRFEDGVCRDELSIAVSLENKTIITVLLESEEKVDIPTTISGIQWIDMSDWRGKYDVDGETGGPVFTAYFDDKMAQILEAVETPENFKAEGEIKALRQSLMMTSTSNTMYFYLLKKEMIGRQWLTEAFNDFVEKDYNNRFLLISGGPGYGKSHFIAHAIHYRPEVIAGYFFDYKKQTENSIKEFVRDMAFQIASRNSSFRENLINRLVRDGFYQPHGDGGGLSDGSERFREFFSKNTPSYLLYYLIGDLLPKSVDGDMGNRIIVIDGVDEAAFNNKNPLVDFLCDKCIDALPSWCKFVITSRNEEELEQYFKFINKMKRINLDCAESETDVQKYLHFRLDDYIAAGKLPERIIDTINRRCERTFIFAEKLCDAYEEDSSILDNPGNIPENIAGLYTLYFDRLFEDGDFSEAKSVLEIITACGGKINQTVLKSMMDWDDGTLNSFIMKMKSFIIRTEENDGKALCFYHKTVGEWLTDPDASGKYTVSSENGEKTIVEFCKKTVAMFTPQNTSVGFKGEKLLVPYVAMKFAYMNTNRFGSTADRRDMMKNLPFLYAVQLQSYIYCEMELSDEVADHIEISYGLMLPEKKKESLLFYLSSKNVIGEIEIAKDNVADALNTLYGIEKKYIDDLKEKFAELYCSVECNICYCIRRTDVAEAEKRMNRLFEFVENTDYTGRESNIANMNYIMCAILYDKAGKLYSEEKYKESEKVCFESIEHGNRSIELSDFLFEDNKGLKLQCYNQIGSCYFRLAKIYEKSGSDKDKVTGCYEKQLKYKKDSLAYRLERYGKYSRYTANALDYAARAVLQLNRWQKKELPPECMENVESALKIFAYLFGKKSPLYARSLQTKVFILEYEERYAEALPFAEEQYEIYSSMPNSFESDIKRAENLLERVRKKVT